MESRCAEVREDGGELRLWFVGFIFCVSGVSALIYQVAWQRILALHSGVGIYSVAMIIAAFLAGLGLGSYAGGLLSARTRPGRALQIFAGLELGVGLFALVSCSLYYDLLYHRAAGLYDVPWRAGVLHFLALLLPTALMGMSLPFLVQAMVRNPRTASRTIGVLYGINVLGAALGALLAPWVFIRLFGIDGAVNVGAAGNLLAGVSALGLAWLAPPVDRERPALSPTPPPIDGAEPAGGRPFALWLGLYTLSGLIALSLEILWFRVIEVAVKSTAFTFGTVLAVFLAGLGVGSMFGGRLALRLRRPLEAFLLCQGVLLTYAGAAMLLLVSLSPEFPFYRSLVAYWAEYEEFKLGLVWDWGRIFSLYLVLPLFLYGPPTCLMGLSFGILQRAVHDERRTSGLKVGVLQAGNIVGNVAGSLLTGLVLLHLLGTMGTLRVLIGLGLVFMALGFRYYGVRWNFAALGAALILLLILLPSGDQLWKRLHGLTDRPGAFDEDATAVTGLMQDEGAIRLSVNGKGHSWLPFGGMHSELGALPAVIHEAPHDVAIIGLGSGDTAWAAGCRSETRSVTVWELAAPEERLLRGIAHQLPQLDRFLSDPRLRILTADGRNALSVNERHYDLIEADALRPHSAYSGNVYSLEFFKLCANKLKPGGLMCTWAPTPRIYRTFCEAFPHVVAFGEEDRTVLVGGNEPIVIAPETWLARIGSPELRAYLGDSVAGPAAAKLRTGRPATPEFHWGQRSNRDLFPRDEFRTPARR